MADVKFEKHTLKNGLKVVLAPMQSTQAATVLVLVGAGSRYETLKTNGLSHFLEHMFFKGTKKRPSSFEITKLIAGVGGINNAFTGEELAGYWIKMPAEHLDLTMEILSDQLKNSLLSQEEIDRESGVIIEERRMYLDDPKSYVGIVAQELIFGDTPLGRNIVGSEKNIKSFKRADFVNYFKSQYEPKNMVAIVSGKINPEKALLMIKKYFGDLKAKRSAKFVPIKATQARPKAKVHYKKSDQSHIILMARTFPRFDKRRYALAVLATILGGNMSSRLFIEIRERRGLAYYVGCDPVDFQDAGFLSVDAGLRLGTEKEAINVILNEFKKLKEIKVEEEEMLRAKEYIKGTMSMGLENSNSVALFLGEQLLLKGKIENTEELKKKIDQVTSKDIQNLANEIFVEKGLNFAMVGPQKSHEKFIKLLKI